MICIMETTVKNSSNYFEGLSLFESPDRILEATKARRNMKSWEDFIKTLTSDSILDFVSRIDKGNIDYCGSNYRRSFSRSSEKVNRWLNNWSSNNILKNACDMLEVWRRPNGISGVFITQNVVDRKEKRLSYWFYQLSSNGKNYELSYIKLTESGEVFKQTNIPIISAIVKVEYDQPSKSMKESYRLSSTVSKDEMTGALLGMILFKTYSTSKIMPRYIYMSVSNFMVNYYMIAETLKDQAPVKEEEVEA